MTADNLALKCDIGIDGEKIAFVGTDPSFQPDIIKDCRGMIALPSFVNTHTHLAMTLMRNYKDDEPTLQAWLEQIFPIEDKLKAEDIKAGSTIGLIELIRSGCTTFADMYFQSEMTIAESIKAGVRMNAGFTLFGDKAATLDRIANRLPRMEEAKGDSPLISICPAVHAIYTCTDDTYRIGCKWAKRNHTPLHTHLSETKKEVEDCIKAHGMSPAIYLDSLGVFDVPTFGAHGVYITDEELPLLREKGVSIVHNPTSNAKLASGIAPVAHFRKQGINVSLGTDGASSNNRLNMLRELNTAALLSSASTLNNASYTPYEILKMATLNGAKALLLDSKIGTLEKGKDADITLFDTASANMTPLNNPFSALVYSAERSDISAVYCRGKLLLENGILQTIDEDKAVKEVNLRWKEILNR